MVDFNWLKSWHYILLTSTIGIKVINMDKNIKCGIITKVKKNMDIATIPSVIFHRSIIRCKDLKACFIVSCSHDQMLIRFISMGLIWVHRVLIGKMSPDIAV